MMWSTLPSAVRFLLELRRPGSAPGERRRTVERFGTAIDVYEPERAARGTIAFVHGMAPAGYRDPRIENLGIALAAAGFRTVIPDIKSIRDLRIRREQTREVLDLLQAIGGDAGLVPGGRFALMAVSFSGVFALHAACRRGLAEPLTGLCLIGAYSNLSELCHFLLHAERADPYPLLLIARSYYTEVEPESDAFLSGLDRCIASSVEHGEDRDPADVLDLDNPDEARVAALLGDAGRREAFEAGLRKAFDDGWRDYVVPLDFARRELPVLLMHGRGDRVIPAEQSRRLARHLGGLGVPHRLCVTGVLTHGDSRLDVQRLVEILRLVRHLAWFFDVCGNEGASPTRDGGPAAISRGRPET